MIQTVSYSQISSFRQCPLKWQLQKVDNLVSPVEHPRRALGSAWHSVLEAHYRTFQRNDAEGHGRNLIEAYAAAEYEIERAGLDAEGQETLRWMYDGYVELYDDDADWEILEVEYEFSVPLARIGKVSYHYHGFIDLIVRERSTGNVYIVDHKSSRGKDATKAAWQRESDLDDQFAGYQAAMQLKIAKKLRLPVTGTVYALARTDKLKRDMVLEERFGRYRAYRSEQTLEATWDDLIATTRAMHSVRTGRMAVWSAPTPDRCGWGCDFVEPHLMARATGRSVADAAIAYGFVVKEGGR